MKKITLSNLINLTEEDISSLKRNYYGYNSLNSNSSIRFASQDNSTIIKLNKDKIINIIPIPTKTPNTLSNIEESI